MSKPQWDGTELKFKEPKITKYPSYTVLACISGDIDIGKRSLGMRIHTGRFGYEKSELPATFERIYLHKCDNKPANIQFKAVITNDIDVIEETDLSIICFAYDDIDSFEMAKGILKQVAKFNIDVRFVGLKADLNEGLIPFAEIEKLKKQNAKKSKSFKFMSLSSLAGMGVMSLMESLELTTGKNLNTNCESESGSDETESTEAQQQESEEEQSDDENEDGRLRFPRPNMDKYPTFASDIVVCGMEGVGKRTLCMRYHTGRAKFEAYEVPQMFKRFFLHEVDQKPANMQVNFVISNDMEIIQQATFIFLCFSFDKLDSFEYVKEVLPKLAKLETDIMIVGCKAELNKGEIGYDMISKVIDDAKKLHPVISYHSVSAATGKGVLALLESIELRE